MNKTALTLFLLALMIRLVYVLFYPQMPVVFDADSYRSIAVNVVQKGFYSSDGINPDTTRPPAYPLFLASLFYFFGKNLIIVRLVQAVLSSLTVVFIYEIAGKMFNKQAAIISALLAIFYPAFIFYSGMMLTETFYTFILIIPFYFFTAKKLNARTAILSGLFFGLASLARPETILLLFFMMLLFFIMGKKSMFFKTFLMIGIMFVVITPWAMRNYTIYDQFFLINTRYGIDFWLSTNPNEQFKDSSLPEELEEKIQNLNPVERAIFLRGEAKRNLVQHPLAYVKTVIKRSFRFWIGSHTESLYGFTESFGQATGGKHYFVFVVKLALLFFNCLIVLMGFVGLFLLLGYSQATVLTKIFLLSPILFKILLHSFLYMTPRFHIPAMPFMIILAGYGLYKLSTVSSKPIQ